MSVTFTSGQWVEVEDGRKVLACGPDHTHTGCTLPVPCEAARLYFGCCDHSMAAEDACGCTALDVNVSNANAVAILARLGYPCDPSCPVGDADPADMLGRAMVANTGLDDSGDPSVSSGGPGTGQALMIDCGHRPGYFGSVMERLAALATSAAERGLLVVWS